MKFSVGISGSASCKFYDYGESWTKEMIDFMITPNVDWKYDELAGKFKCKCGKRALYIKDEMGTGFPDKLCFDCWEEWISYMKELIMWKRRKKLPRNQWQFIPQPRNIFDTATEWD